MPEETEGRTPLSPPLAPGWHADPSGRFDVRYHNGFAWTHDVARDGQRFVDSEDHRKPAPTSPTPPATPPKNPIATAALVLGICSICLAWMPFLFAVGGILAVLALVFGAVGIRRARDRGLEQSRAVVGLVTGTIGLVSVAAGIALTVVLLRAVDRFDNPAANEVSLDSCETTPTTNGESRTWRAAGTVTNVDDVSAQFTVKVFVREPGGRRVIAEEIEEIDRLEPGQAAAFDITGAQTIRFEPDCTIEILGPLVFGVDISD